MSSSSESGEQVTLDEATTSVIEQQRREATKGGARYRQVARDRSAGQPAMDNECKNCTAHVSDLFARVMGLGGQVFACPECADTAQITAGAAAGLERRHTL